MDYYSTYDINNIPIFIINLDRRPDRMKITEKQMLKFSTDYIRFSAVDTGNTIGCAKSYFKILDENSDKNAVLIIQDDIVLLDYSKKIWNLHINYVPNDWDIILGGVHFGNIEDYVNEYVIKLNDFSGLQMALFKPTILQLLKQWNEKGGFDRFIGKLATEKKLNIYCILPFCSIQSDGYSDLRHSTTKDYILFKKYEYFLCSSNSKKFNCKYKYSL